MVSNTGALSGAHVSKHETSFALASSVIEEESEDPLSYAIKAVHPGINC